MQTITFSNASFFVNSRTVLYNLVKEPFSYARGWKWGTLTCLALILAGMLLAVSLPAQKAQWMYKIARDGQQIGWMKLQKTDSGGRMSLSLNSEVKTRFIIPLDIGVTDLATFEQGRLVHSGTIRGRNNRTKMDKQTRLKEVKT